MYDVFDTRYRSDVVLRGMKPWGEASITNVRDCNWLQHFENVMDPYHLPILHALLGQLRGFVRVARLDSTRPSSVLTQVSVEHELIVDALERRDAKAALAALIEHLHTSDYAIAAGRRPRRKLRT